MSAPTAPDDVLTTTQLRVFLKLDGEAKERTWYRVKPFFAPALRTFDGHHPVYWMPKVRTIMEGKQDARSPLNRSRLLRKVG